MGKPIVPPRPLKIKTPINPSKEAVETEIINDKKESEKQKSERFSKS